MDPRQQVLDFLTERMIVTLVTVDRHGYPTGRRVGFINDGFECWVPAQRTTAKVAQLRRSPKATLTTYDPSNNKYLQIKADVVIEDDPDVVWAKRQRYVQKYTRVAGSLTPESRPLYVGVRLIPREVRGDGIAGPAIGTVLKGTDLAG